MSKISDASRRETAGERTEGWLIDAIVENIPVMLFVKDADSLRFKLFNKAGEELLGHTRAEMLGRNDYDFFPPDQAMHFQAKDREVLESGHLVEIIEPISTPRGERILSTKKIPLCDPEGKLRYLVGISEDITEKKRLEELERAHLEAEAKSRAKSEFLANVSHELRTPLTLVLGPLTAVLRGDLGALPERARQRLEIVTRNAARIARLVDDVLDFTKLDAGKLKVSLAPTDVVQAARQLVDDARPHAEERRLALSLEAPDALGVIDLDRVLFEKIMLNLIGNALKFTPPGGAITVTVRREGEGFELAVRDTGIGIPAEEVGHIFERYEQAAAAHRQEGTGLGLALVKQFAEMMGGRVGVDSEVGKGSCFHVCLPARPSSHTDASALQATGHGLSLEMLATAVPEHRAQAEPRLVPPGVAPYVMVVEDDDDMRGYIAESLGTDLPIVRVADGRAALEVAHERPPEVIVSDVMMPELSGLDLVRSMKSDPALAEVPVVLLTARAGGDEAADALDAGAEDYVTKPFAPAELRARVRAARRRRAQRPGRRRA
jgi:PAS domain S-box-containing protein